jgi:hypothetical protein
MQDVNNPALGGGPQATIVGEKVVSDSTKDRGITDADPIIEANAADPIVDLEDSGDTGTLVSQSQNPALLAMVDSYNAQSIMTDAAADIAREQALLMQSRDMLTAEQNAIASRANIERNAARGQEQALLGEYSTQQTIEKMGWTGGYRTDAETQMSYLRASIASDLYSQMELQRLGYETALEQARINFSLNNIQLANEYMNQQWQIEFQRANITGELISPIDRENVNQFKAADTIIKAQEGTYTAEQVAKAQQVYNQLLEWYGGEGIGQQGLAALYEISTLTRNAQQFEMNQAQLDQIELNMTLSVQSAAREIQADGEIPIIERNDKGDVTNIYGINPTSTKAEDIAKAQEYYRENPLEFVSLIENYERYQVNQYLAALDAGTYKGTYEGFLKEFGSDTALTLYERFAEAAQYEDGFADVDPFNGLYRKSQPRLDEDGNVIPPTNYDDTINNVNLSITERNNAANQFFREQGINGALFSGTSARAQYLSYKNVENLFKDGAKSNITLNNLYGSLNSIVLKDQGSADDKAVAGKLNALYQQVLGDTIEFGFAARPAMSGFLGIGNNGLQLVDRQGNDLTQADFNALPDNQRKILEDMGFEFKTGRNRYLLIGSDANNGDIVSGPRFTLEKERNDIINPNLTVGGITNIEKTERNVFLTGLYYLMKDQYISNLDGAAVAGAAAGGN